MKQATIPAFIPDIIQEHRYKYMPHCADCGDQFTETGFLALERTGYNIVWDIDYARCSICGGQVQGWRRDVQSWRARSI